MEVAFANAANTVASSRAVHHTNVVRSAVLYYGVIYRYRTLTITAVLLRITFTYATVIKSITLITIILVSLCNREKYLYFIYSQNKLIQQSVYITLIKLYNVWVGACNFRKKSRVRV